MRTMKPAKGSFMIRPRVSEQELFLLTRLHRTEQQLSVKFLQTDHFDVKQVDTRDRSGTCLKLLRLTRFIKLSGTTRHFPTDVTFGAVSFSISCAALNDGADVKILSCYRASAPVSRSVHGVCSCYVLRYRVFGSNSCSGPIMSARTGAIQMSEEGACRLIVFVPPIMHSCHTRWCIQGRDGRCLGDTRARATSRRVGHELPRPS